VTRPAEVHVAPAAFLFGSMPGAVLMAVPMVVPVSVLMATALSTSDPLPEERR
jgi:hypothetical protein